MRDEAVDGTDFYGEPALTVMAPPTPVKPAKSKTPAASLATFTRHTLAELDNYPARVWLILFADTDPDKGTARTSYADIAEQAGCSVSSVKRAVEDLKARGLLKVSVKGGLGKGPNGFRVFAVDSRVHAAEKAGA